MVTETQLAYRINSAARVLDLSRDTVERLIGRGLIKSYKVGAARFIEAEELQRFIEARKSESN